MLTRIRTLLNKLVKKKDGVTYRSTKFLRAPKNNAQHRIQKIYNPVGKQVHGGYVMGAWLFRPDIDHVKLQKCIEQSLLYYPWYASRVTEVVDEFYTLKNDNQGLKYNIVCNPSLSLKNKADLEFALKPKNRVQFFDDSKSVLRVRQKEMQNIPPFSIQLTYLGRDNMDQVDNQQTSGNEHGCVLSFKFSHGVGDATSGYRYMKYLSDLMNKYDINEIDSNIHQITMEELNNELPTLYNIDMDKLKEYTSQWKDEDEFKEYFESVAKDTSVPYRKYWLKPAGLKTKLQKLSLPYHILSFINGDYFEIKIPQRMIDDLTQKFVAESNGRIKRLSAYTVVTGFILPLFAKYQPQWKYLWMPVNFRGKYLGITENMIGNLTGGLCMIDLEENDYKTGFGIVSKMNNALDIYARKNKGIDGYENVEEVMNRMVYDRFAVVFMYGEDKYMINFDYEMFLRNELFLANEFKSINVYDNYTFGTNDIPIYYMFASGAGNRYIVLGAPPTDKDGGVRVFVTMDKKIAKRFREGEKEFLAMHDVNDNCLIHL